LLRDGPYSVIGSGNSTSHGTDGVCVTTDTDRVHEGIRKGLGMTQEGVNGRRDGFEGLTCTAGVLGNTRLRDRLITGIEVPEDRVEVFPEDPFLIKVGGKPIAEIGNPLDTG